MDLSRALSAVVDGPAGHTLLVGLVSFVLLTAIKRALRSVGMVSCLDSRLGQAGLYLAPAVSGALLAVLPGVLPDQELAVRVLLGVAGGAFGERLYLLVRSRFPQQVVSGETRRRAREEGG